ncbi:hypothetical protein [Litchfieldia alkalitelluris]|uniref:hypothetical protein n=1 Tax=Litchfieldia alkalitelluris TaxID=304268 RepID=UPI000996B218|nr:hypothetical protein [Litchfieldia alkalitelluris]
MSNVQVDFDQFNEYVDLVKKLDYYLLSEMKEELEGYQAFRMDDIKDGIAYHRIENRAKDGFVKLCSANNAIILRFGSNTDNNYKGLVKQHVVDKHFNLLNKRTEKHLNKFANEAFIYFETLENLINIDDWEFVKQLIKEAYTDKFLDKE